MTERDNCPHTDDCPHASASAELAVKKVFAILGVDIDVPKEVEEFRENLRFGATMKKAVDKGIFAVAAAIATAVAAAVWVGITKSLTGH